MPMSESQTLLFTTQHFKILQANEPWFVIQGQIRNKFFYIYILWDVVYGDVQTCTYQCKGLQVHLYVSTFMTQPIHKCSYITTLCCNPRFGNPWCQQSVCSELQVITSTQANLMPAKGTTTHSQQYIQVQIIHNDFAGLWSCGVTL
jgi:hypothetical protein